MRYHRSSVLALGTALLLSQSCSALYVSTTSRGASLPGGSLLRGAAPVCMASLPLHLATMEEELASGEAQLFDVRELAEYEGGSLVQSVMVPLSELQEGTLRVENKDQLTYVHCAKGLRAKKAKPLLEKLGFERVVALEEGISTLIGLGFPLKE